jgi:hypothetical protein
MLPNLPIWIYCLFIVAIFFDVFFFYLAAGKSKTVLAVIAVWLIAQAVLAGNHFYLQTAGMPPKFALAIFPPLLLIIFLFVTKKGKALIGGLDMHLLTILSIIRIPVEFVLYGLYTNKAVPELMTFAGINFDIFSGITAPVMYLVCFKKGTVRHQKLLLAWNIVCLLLVLNVMIRGVLSAPLPFQQFAFDQPNLAVLYFPFVWLPCCIVPLVIISHLASIQQLTAKK